MPAMPQSPRSKHGPLSRTPCRGAEARGSEAGHHARPNTAAIELRSSPCLARTFKPDPSEAYRTAPEAWKVASSSAGTASLRKIRSLVYWCFQIVGWIARSKFPSNTYISSKPANIVSRILIAVSPVINPNWPIDLTSDLGRQRASASAVFLPLSRQVIRQEQRRTNHGHLSNRASIPPSKKPNATSVFILLFSLGFSARTGSPASLPPRLAASRPARRSATAIRRSPRATQPQRQRLGRTSQDQNSSFSALPDERNGSTAKEVRR